MVKYGGNLANDAKNKVVKMSRSIITMVWQYLNILALGWFFARKRQRES